MEKKNPVPVDPKAYFDSQGIELKPTESPDFFVVEGALHEGCSSFEVNIKTGAWHCKNGCGASGKSVVDFHAITKRINFFQAANELKAWGNNYLVRSEQKHGRCYLGALSEIKDQAEQIQQMIYEYRCEEGELDDEGLMKIFKLAFSIESALKDFGI